MEYNRNLVCFLATVFLCCQAISYAFQYDISPPQHRNLLFFPIFPVPKPQHSKPFGIFSEPSPNKPTPDEIPKKPLGGGILSHVLHGGGISVEIRPLAPLQGIIDHAKKFIPGSTHGTVGRPNYEQGNIERPHHDRPPKERPHHDRPHFERPHRPDKERPHHDRPHFERPHQDRPHFERPHHDRPNKEWPHQDRPHVEQPHPDRPDKGRPHHDRPNKEWPHQDRPHVEQPHHERPNKDHEWPNKEVDKDHPQPPKKDTDDWETNKKDPEKKPGWDDIGEVPDKEDFTDDYGEGLLQPRLKRPKRFVDSKIYHVPLLYRSNGRPHQVILFKGRNGLKGSAKEV